MDSGFRRNDGEGMDSCFRGNDELGSFRGTDQPARGARFPLSRERRGGGPGFPLPQETGEIARILAVGATATEISSETTAGVPVRPVGTTGWHPRIAAAASARA